MLYIKRTTEEKQIHEALRSNNLVVISGAAGVGKTTIIMEMLHKYQWNAQYFNVELCGKLIGENAEPISNTTYIFDDVNDCISEFIKSEYVEKIRKCANSKVIIITRADYKSKTIPVVKIDVFSDSERREFLRAYELPERDARLIADASRGNARILTMFAAIARDEGISSDKIVGALSNESSRELLQEYSVKSKSITKTSGVDREVLYQVTVFGPIKKSKLVDWNPEKDIDTILDTLLNNSYITISGDDIFATSKILKFTEREKKTYIEHLLIIFEADTADDIKTEDDVYKLLHEIKELNNHASYIITFLEARCTLPTNPYDEINDKLNELIAICLNTNSNVEEIGTKLDDIKKNALDEIERIKEAAQDDEEVLNMLNELIQIVNNPKKSKLGIANNILGAVGSCASIASVMGVSNLGDAINNLLSLFTRLMR